jgi:hypothetical protein
VLIASISFVGYYAMKLVGPHRLDLDPSRRQRARDGQQQALRRLWILPRLESPRAIAGIGIPGAARGRLLAARLIPNRPPEPTSVLGCSQFHAYLMAEFGP